MLRYRYIACLVDNGEAVCLLIGRSYLCVLFRWIRSYVSEVLTASCQHTDKIVGWTAAVRVYGSNHQRRTFPAVQRLGRETIPHLVLHTGALELYLHIYIPSRRRALQSTVTGVPFCCLCSDDALRGLNSWLLCVSVVSNPLTHWKMHVRGSGCTPQKKAASRAFTKQVPSTWYTVVPTGGCRFESGPLYRLSGLKALLGVWGDEPKTRSWSFPCMCFPLSRCRIFCLPLCYPKIYRSRYFGFIFIIVHVLHASV